MQAQAFQEIAAFQEITFSLTNTSVQGFASGQYISLFTNTNLGTTQENLRKEVVKSEHREKQDTAQGRRVSPHRAKVAQLERAERAESQAIPQGVSQNGTASSRPATV